MQQNLPLISCNNLFLLFVNKSEEDLVMHLES